MQLLFRWDLFPGMPFQEILGKASSVSIKRIPDPEQMDQHHQPDRWGHLMTTLVLSVLLRNGGNGPNMMPGEDRHELRLLGKGLRLKGELRVLAFLNWSARIPDHPLAQERMPLAYLLKQRIVQSGNLLRRDSNPLGLQQGRTNALHTHVMQVTRANQEKRLLRLQDVPLVSGQPVSQSGDDAARMGQTVRGEVVMMRMFPQLPASGHDLAQMSEVIPVN
ncbi:MAG: hypothetical protein H7A45_00080 [Verrucomicrobiales bacterium]|nr:hypothetical protein [Verrucomicrobiales bacterium]